jgi:hypothetical protein
MAKKGQNKLSLWIKVVFIGASLPFLHSHQSWAIDCTKTNDINLKIEEFKDKDSKKVDAAINAVVNCGENAIAPLKEAWITNPNVAVRANAILTLGKIGAREILQDAGSELPELVVDLENSKDDNVSRIIVSSLLQIGDAVVNKPNHEFEWWKLKPIEDIEALKKSLEKAHKIINKDEKKWASKDQQIKELRSLIKIELSNKLETLTDRKSYQVRLWFHKNPWVWLPAGYLIVNLGIFIFRPTWLLKMDESFRQATFSLTGKLRMPLPVFLNGT